MRAPAEQCTELRASRASNTFSLSGGDFAGADRSVAAEAGFVTCRMGYRRRR